MTQPNRLLVFAHPDETQAFRDVPHLVTGIGKIQAAASLGERLARERVDEVVVLGTAGMLDDLLDLNTVYRITGTMQHDFEFPTDTLVLNSEGSVTAVSPTEWETGRYIPEDSPAEAEAVIATGDVFVTDDTLREELLTLGAHLVDMESYAYAALCQVFEIPIRIYKIPSDLADSATTHLTWDEIVAHKSTQLREFAQREGLV